MDSNLLLLVKLDAKCNSSLSQEINNFTCFLWRSPCTTVYASSVL